MGPSLGRSQLRQADELAIKRASDFGLMAALGSLREFPLSAAKRTKLPVRFNYGSCSSRNGTGHSQRALSVLPIQTDRLFDETLRVLHKMRWV
jgi:hypothetical protein